MIKYYSELDKPNDFNLPLIKKYPKNKKEIITFKLPINFYSEHPYIFDVIKYTINLVENINLDELFKYIIVYNKECLDLYPNIEDLLYTDFGYIKDTYNKIDLYPYELKNILSFCKKILCYMYDVYKNQNYIYMIKEIKTVLKELSKCSTIEYNENPTRNIILPNSWYITPLNDLYNTGGNHKQNNLEYPFEELKNCIYNNINIDEKQKYLNELNDIKTLNYINKSQFKFYLNYSYGYVSFDETENNKCYNPKIVKTVYGVVSAHAAVYQFFENLQKYTSNPKQELDKILEITGNNFDDILVRCVGFHKMAVCQKKLIATSKVACGEEFLEYLKRGWNISFIPPIIINKEKKQIEELNVNSSIIEKCIEKDRNKYEKIKEYRYGKIY